MRQGRRDGLQVVHDCMQGCGIKGFLPTSVIQGNPPLYEENSVWEALSVVSQKWIPFPTALIVCVFKGALVAVG